jgi:hypothetical protein
VNGAIEDASLLFAERIGLAAGKPGNLPVVDPIRFFAFLC